jgi:hypothetical protein
MEDQPFSLASREEGGKPASNKARWRSTVSREK